MAKLNIKITSILDGMSPSWHFGSENQYLAGVSIDPEGSDSTFLRATGSIFPTRYTKFSAGKISAAPMWILTNPKNTNIYTYLDNGGFLSYSNTLGSETLIGTPTAGAGNGAIYYNDYIYLMTPTDVSRYGSLSGGSPTLTNTYWTSTLSATALTDTAYPSTRSVEYPNHAPHLHVDNKVYFCDYINGQGKIHYIKTTNTGVNNGSTYGALDLPFGFLPMDIESFGTDLAILATFEGQWASGAIPKPGSGALFLWDTFSSSFYRQINLGETIASSLLNKNGELFLWSGTLGTGVRVGRYLGGDSIQPIINLKEGAPPVAGAVDSIGSKLFWGGFQTYPTAAAGIFSLGYANAQLPGSALNFMGRISDSTNTLPIVTSLKLVSQSSTGSFYPYIGWRTDTTAAYGIDQLGGSAAYTSIFRSQVFNVGQEFSIKKVRIPLSVAIASGMTITPKIYVDDEVTSFTLTTINSTNYPNSERTIDISPVAVRGQHNFYLELAFTGTTEVAANLPINISVETLRDI